MDHDGQEQVKHGNSFWVAQKGPRLSRNDQKWESLRQEIHRLYMTEKNTLPKTMLIIEEKYCFKAS
jgi:hypothetical protein